MSRARDAAAEAKADDALRALVRPLWSATDTSAKLAVLAEVDALGVDMADLRVAQPALCVLYADAEPAVVRAAVAITERRAFYGADIRLALPSLALIAEHPDVGVRRLVWQALATCDSRHDTALAALSGVPARLAGNDPDPTVRSGARTVAERIAAPACEAAKNRG